MAAKKNGLAGSVVLYELDSVGVEAEADACKSPSHKPLRDLAKPLLHSQV